MQSILFVQLCLALLLRQRRFNFTESLCYSVSSSLFLLSSLFFVYLHEEFHHCLTKLDILPAILVTEAVVSQSIQFHLDC